MSASGSDDAATRNAVLSRLFKWDHVNNKRFDSGTKDHVLGKLMNSNASANNYDIQRSPDLTFDLLLARMIETYAMYVYCPADNITVVIKTLSDNTALLKSAILRESKSETAESVYAVLGTFISLATDIVARKYFATRVSAHETDNNVDMLKIYTSGNNDLEQHLYETIRLAGKLEAYRFSRDENGKSGVQKNLKSDTNNMNITNIDDMLKRNEKLRSENYLNSAPCDNAKAKLQRDDFSIACNLNKNRGLDEYVKDEVKDFLRGSIPAKLTNSAFHADPSPLSTDSVQANNLYKAYVMLLDQARLRLSHGSDAYSDTNKLSLLSDSTMSESYVRFYDRHLTDFVRSIHPASGVHAFFLGALVAQVHFKIMRTACDNFVNRVCASADPEQGACSPNVAVQVNAKKGRDGNVYSGVYSSELRMFHLTARQFVDQFIIAYHRLDRETNLILNEFAFKPGKLTPNDLKAFAGDMYGKYLAEENKPENQVKIENVIYKKRAGDPGISYKYICESRVAGPSKCSITAEQMEKARSVLDNVDLVSLQGVPTRTTAPLLKPFSLKNTKNPKCPYVLAYSPCDVDAELGCYTAVDRGETINAIKAFDMSAKERAMINISNSVMLGYSAVMHQGTTLLGFGGSGVGKTSFFFGRPGVDGLFKFLFKSLPPSYPFHDQSKTTVELTVTELYRNHKLFYDGEGRRVGTQVELEYPFNDTIETKVRDLIEKVDATRKNKESKPMTIRPTLNNPSSSRSVMIYRLNLRYTGSSKGRSANIHEDKDDEYTERNKKCVGCGGEEVENVTVPITLVDLPGYELTHMLGEGIDENETKFINKAVTDSLKWAYSGEMPAMFSRLGFEKMASSRLLSFVVFNNSSGNVKKQRLEAVVTNQKMVSARWSKTKLVDELTAATGVDEKNRENLLALLKYSSEYVGSHIRMAHKMFHKFHEDQRLTFKLIKDMQPQNMC